MKVLLINAFCLMLCLCCSEMEVKWVQNIQPAGRGTYVCNDIASGYGGAVMVTGSFCGPDQIPGCFTALYDGNGDLTWHHIYTGEPGEITYGLALGWGSLAMQTKPENYVLCQARRPDEAGRLVVLKYDNEGNLQWERTVKSGIENMYGELMLDMQGNVVVCVWLSILGEPDNIFLAKVDPEGTLLWSTMYAHPSFYIRDVHFDMRTGEQIIVGGIADVSEDFFYLRYGEQGNLQSLTIVNLESKEQACAAVRLGANGSVYLTGASESDTSYKDFVTAMLDAKDSLVWVQYHDGDKHDDAATAIAVDEAGNAYVTGMSTDDYGRTRIVSMGYDVDGNKKWMSTYIGSKDENAVPYALFPPYLDRMLKDRAQYFYLTGRVGNDILILRHGTGGLYTWAHREKSKQGGTYSLAGVAYNSLIIAETSERGPAALICRYGKAEQWGCARWD
ncbi:MAG: SBBP repeat-containing protein [candidate division WOR-3 bacterium]|nr:MAG: SBBP repeat-containing protein [candidate division WOR-3 bacterium]